MDFLTEPVSHDEAADFIKGKPAVQRDVFDKLLPELKARAFTVAGLEKAEELQAVRDMLAELPQGGDWDEIKREIAGKISPYMVDPDADPEVQANQRAAGERKAELLLRLHGFQAYSAASHNAIMEQADIFPYCQYKSMADGKVRASHRALHDIILPTKDPFWQGHTGPWTWGCRCQKVGLMDIDVREIREADAGKPPEKQRIIEGEARRQLVEGGRLVRGPSEIYDVRTAAQKGEKNGFSWTPGDMRLPLETLKARYDAPVWAAFEAWAKKENIPETNLSVWGWLEGKPIALAAPKAIYDAETRIAGDKARETAVACNPDGDILLEKTGEPDRVELTAAEIGRISGGTLTHNHPSGESFSLEDLHVALHAALAEIRVVGINSAGILHLHSLRPASGAWRAAAWTQIEKAFNEISAKVESGLRADIAAGRMSPQQAGDEHNHLVLSQLAAKYPNIFRYERTRL